MGVGLPENILESIALGIDMFDCVLPSRNARHGILYTWDGVINIKNLKWAEDFNPIDPNSLSPTSRTHTKSYLRHLFKVGEVSGMQIASLHNLTFYLELVNTAREKMIDGTFSTWKDGVMRNISNRL